jgi:hypothetical protein
MSEVGRLTKEEWDDLEPRLAEAERSAHQHYMESSEVHSLLGETDKTPGYLLLRRLKALDDEELIGLFRAMEMYQHELTRADITVAFLRGKEIGRAEGA